MPMTESDFFIPTNWPFHRRRGKQAPAGLGQRNRKENAPNHPQTGNALRPDADSRSVALVADAAEAARNS